jgi:hypothetical protein
MHAILVRETIRQIEISSRTYLGPCWKAIVNIIGYENIMNSDYEYDRKYISGNYYFIMSTFRLYAPDKMSVHKCSDIPRIDTIVYIGRNIDPLRFVPNTIYYFSNTKYLYKRDVYYFQDAKSYLEYGDANNLQRKINMLLVGYYDNELHHIMNKEELIKRLQEL